ncbi:hypothetical protein RYX36_002726, partial [Vicia faba]
MEIIGNFEKSYLMKTEWPTKAKESGFFQLSPTNTKISTHVAFDISDGEDNDEINVEKEKPSSTNYYVVSFICEMCTKKKSENDTFLVCCCSYAYCADCVALYVSSKLEDNVINMRCPVSECNYLLEAKDCLNMNLYCK